jgi:hypothetical protein
MERRFRRNGPPKTAAFDIHDDAALDAFLKQTLAEVPAMSEELDERVQQMLEDWEAERQPDDQVLARLDRIEAELRAIRHEVSGLSQYTPGRVQRVVEEMAGDVKLRLGVVLHQIGLLMAGKPLTISKEAFPSQDFEPMRNEAFFAGRKV